VESPFTLKGEHKELFYDKNKERFAKFQDKIIHLVYEPSTPAEKQPKWRFETLQRDTIMHGLEACRPEDIVLISDVDEIPDPEIILHYTASPGIKVFEQQLMYYYMNFACWTNPIWHGTRMGTYFDLLNPKQDLEPLEYFSFSAKGLPTYFRFCQGEIIPNAGWHFSYCGGAAAVRQKKQSITDGYDYNADISETEIEKIIKKGRDIHGRDVFFKITPPDSLPQYIIANKSRYATLILTLSFCERIYFSFFHACNLLYFYKKKIVRKLRKPLSFCQHGSQDL
jgi:beta-1,4-mannosyl-glycoprotein beta-1,4-N-acetylglucosaminyltransferase